MRRSAQLSFSVAAVLAGEKSRADGKKPLTDYALRAILAISRGNIQEVEIEDADAVAAEQDKDFPPDKHDLDALMTPEGEAAVYGGCVARVRMRTACLCMSLDLLSCTCVY